MSDDRAMVRRGKVWMFGDDIDTDIIFPTTAFRLPVAEQHRSAFAAIRPGWAELVQPGDLLVAGTGFGTGSGRPVGRILSACGIAGVIAASTNGLCLRNCINFGLPILQCAAITSLCAEGDHLEVDFIGGRITNLSREGEAVECDGMPDLFCAIIDAGGVIPLLQQEGFVEREG